MMRRVVVTGMGAITPLGLNVDEFFENVKAGNHGFGPITRFDASEYKAKVAAEVKGFVGDDSGMHDCMGTALKIGDTVSLNGYPRLVMQDMPSQKTLLECGCKKIKDCSEMDIQDAFSCAFTVSLHSCLEDYENSLAHSMEMRL